MQPWSNRGYEYSSLSIFPSFITWLIKLCIQGSCTFEYLPLKSGTMSGRLIFTSSDLGTYQYDLNLTALPPAPEPPTHYNTWLGATQTHAVKFTNFSKHKTEFIVKIDSPDWSTERAIPVAQAATAGSEVTFDVNYEPTQLGKRSTMMTVSQSE